MSGSRRAELICVATFFVFLAVSSASGFDPGKRIGGEFISFSKQMLKLLPCAFVLIGLFDVWVKRETIERHLGESSGLRGHLGAVLLAGSIVGGIYVAFPLAHALRRKGAALGVVFTFIGASAICRVPMTVFEASFMGIRFTAIRLATSLPLVIISSAIMGAILRRRRYDIQPSP